VLSNLAAVGRLDLLEERYRKMALTTVEVSDELRKGVQAGYGYYRMCSNNFRPSARVAGCVL
jgi:predicted nucleic acid-binding protein